MEISELISKYKEAIVKNHEYSYKDAKIANKNYDLFIEYYKELKKTDEGINELKKLIYNENPVIQITAATHLLPFNEAAAKAVLKELEEKKIQFVSLDVKYILKGWEKGTLKKYLLSL